jgi:hypothetical protein
MFTQSTAAGLYNGTSDTVPVTRQCYLITQRCATDARKWLTLSSIFTLPVLFVMNAPFGRFSPSQDSIFLVDGQCWAKYDGAILMNRQASNHGLSWS